LAGTHDLTVALAQAVNAAGHKVVVVYSGTEFQCNSEHEFTIDLARREHYRELLKAVPPATVYKILHLCSLTPEELPVSGAERFKLLQSCGYYSLLSLGQALAEASLKADVLVVTDRLNQVDSSDIALPEKQTMLAVCQVVPQETPTIRFRSLEVDPFWASESPDRVALCILEETGSATREMLVAYRGSRRFVRSFDPVKLDMNSKIVRKLKEKGVYVITGGFGGVGICIAEHLARTLAAKLVLISRTPVPARELWQEHLTAHSTDAVSARIRQIQELEALGSEVMALSPDLTDPETDDIDVQCRRARFRES
jgi:phthiocerol/phenolphthiocerol synthesis type-I polyketide synthase E